MPSNKNFLFFASEIAKEAGKILLKGQNDFKIVHKKDIQDIATTVDLASEKFLIKTILKRFPEHGIMSEEIGEINPKAIYKWIIDPLDGSKEYIRSVPLWNCSFCLMHEKMSLVSVVYRPQEGVLYTAAEGLGSFRNGNKISVLTKGKLVDSFIYCYLPSFKRQKEKYEWAFDKLREIGKHCYRLRAVADENTALCWLAQGASGAYLNLSNPPKLHDIAPGLLIAKEAGAYAAKNTMPLVVASNKNIYNELIKIIND